MCLWSNFYVCNISAHIAKDNVFPDLEYPKGLGLGLKPGNDVSDGFTRCPLAIQFLLALASSPIIFPYEI